MNASQGVAQAAASAAAHAQAHRLSQAHSCRGGGARIGVEQVPGQGCSPDDPDPASGTPGLACRVVPAEPRAASGASSKSNGHGAGSAGSSRSRAQGGLAGGQEDPAGGKQSMPRVRGCGAQPQPGCPPCSSSSASAAPGTARGAPAKMQIIAEDAAQCAPGRKHAASETADEAEADKAQQGSGAGGVRAGEQGGKGGTQGGQGDGRIPSNDTEAKAAARAASMEHGVPKQQGSEVQPGKESEAMGGEADGQCDGLPSDVAMDERMTTPETPEGRDAGGGDQAEEAPAENMVTAGEVAKQAPDIDEVGIDIFLSHFSLHWKSLPLLFLQSAFCFSGSGMSLSMSLQAVLQVGLSVGTAMPAVALW